MKGNDIVTADDIAEFLKVNRRSAIQRLYKLTLKHKAIRLTVPRKRFPCKYKLLVPMEELLEDKEYKKQKQKERQDPTINWVKFCSDPFRLTKEVTE